MEAVAEGAVRAGGRCTGIIVPAMFPKRTGGNPSLTAVEECPTLLSRITRMCASSCAFVVLPGKIGTLAELVLAWNLVALADPDKRCPRLLAYADPWKPLMQQLMASLGAKDMLRHIAFVKDVEGVLKGLPPAPGMQ